LVGLYWQGKEKVFAIDPVVGPVLVAAVGMLVAVVDPDPVVVAAVEAVKTVGALKVGSVSTTCEVEAVGTVRPQTVGAIGAVAVAVGAVCSVVVGAIEVVRAVGVVHHSVAVVATVVAVVTFGLATVVAGSVDSEHGTAADQEG
jgi:hypothetical protein